MATFLLVPTFPFPFTGFVPFISVEVNPITWTEFGANGGLPKDLSTDVERCREISDPPDDRSAEAQRAGMGGLLNPELTDVLKGLLKYKQNWQSSQNAFRNYF